MLKPAFFFIYLAPSGAKYWFIGVWEAVSCWKPTGREGCVGLRRENFGFPESRILKPSFLWFSTQIDQFWTTFAVTHLLHDQWASLSLPADPARVFHPVCSTTAVPKPCDITIEAPKANFSFTFYDFFGRFSYLIKLRLVQGENWLVSTTYGKKCTKKE